MQLTVNIGHRFLIIERIFRAMTMLTTTIAEEITECLTSWIAQVKGLGAMGYHHYKIAAENLSADLLNITCDLSLENLNSTKTNYPAIDIGDHKKGICYQVTFDDAHDKIKDTISKYNSAEVNGTKINKTFPTLRMLIWNEKLPRTPEYDFVWYTKDILKEIGNKNIETQKRFLACLKEHLSSHNTENKPTNAINISNNTVGRDVHIHNNINSYAHNTEIDDVALNEIFNYIKAKTTNKPVEKIDPSVITPLKEKISLNFSGNALQTEVNTDITEVFHIIQHIGKFIESKTQTQGGVDDINGIKHNIQMLFRKIASSPIYNAEIKNSIIIDEMTLNLVPDTKRKESKYRLYTKAIVYYFFERCDFGKKTTLENNNMIKC